ncbi:MAG: hypothetical protein AAF597_16925 [Bacteroidota bacterium]
MKNLIYLAILLVSVVSIPAEAAGAANPDEPMIVRSQMGIMGLEVILANLQQTSTRITLTSLDTEKEYFSDVVRKHNGYSWNLKLDELPKGRYLLSVKKGDTLRRQVILKTKAGVMTSDWK